MAGAHSYMSINLPSSYCPTRMLLTMHMPCSSVVWGDVTTVLCVLQAPEPDTNDLSADEVASVKLFQQNTPSVLNISNVGMPARHHMSPIMYVYCCCCAGTHPKCLSVAHSAPKLCVVRIVPYNHVGFCSNQARSMVHRCAESASRHGLGLLLG